MQFIKVKTRTFLPPKDDIYCLINDFVPTLKQGDVFVITSKVLAIHQGRCLKITKAINKEQLIVKEADRYLPRSKVPRQRVALTVKENTLIPNAGIDVSNANGYYILWPKRSRALAREIYHYLKRKFKLKQLGVIITDSHTIPLRYGVIGISIGFHGFKPLIDCRGQPDLFGRKLKITKVNIVDALSAMAGLLMGQGNESTPIIIIRGADFIEFTNQDKHQQLIIPEKIDIYNPLFKIFSKAKKK